MNGSTLAPPTFVRIMTCWADQRLKGTVLTNVTTSADLVFVPGGCFRMGSSLEQIERCFEFWRFSLVDPAYEGQFRSWLLKEVPQHERKIEPFWMLRHPVTNAEYSTFVSERSYAIPESLKLKKPATHPVWGVTVLEAMAYTEWFGEKLSCDCRLPTEAEWEYVARGRGNLEYPFGNEWNSALCNTVESGRADTTPVDRFSRVQSPFGVLDLAGNVEEWTGDVYAPYPGGTFVDDDISMAVGRNYHILRGGSFALGGDLARCARRHGPHPSPQFRYRGFRIVVPA